MLQTDLYSFSYKKGSVCPWCKRCGGENFHRDGRTRTGRQLYECVRCKYRFVWTSDLPHRTMFSNVMMFATELYSTVGISLRTLSKKLKHYFDITISHEGIRKWVLASRKLHFVDERPPVSGVWHIDETYVKIKGKGFWLWIVYSRESQQVIGWHLSQTHLLTDAIAVLRTALRTSEGTRPEKIVTDGLWQYPAAIKLVLRWNWHEQKRRHVIDSGIGKNAVIERVNREVKRRTKWFSTFQAFDGAQAFFGLFFYHYNQRRRVNPIGLT